MIDKRFWSGAIAIVTLIVAGASALPELLLPPASSESTIVLPRSAPKAEPAMEPERTAAIVPSAAAPTIDHPGTIALPAESTAASPQSATPPPEMPKPQPEAAATPAPAPPVAFPPVQPVGVAVASAPVTLPPAASQATEANPVRPSIEKLPRPERSARRPAKPRQTVRPAAYPIKEFLAWRR